MVGPIVKKESTHGQAAAQSPSQVAGAATVAALRKDNQGVGGIINTGLDTPPRGWAGIPINIATVLVPLGNWRSVTHHESATAATRFAALDGLRIRKRFGCVIGWATPRATAWGMIRS
jgi:hypothetical protein